MTEFVDYRSEITLSQAGCNACFILCNYKGQERKFFLMVRGGHTMISVVSSTRNMDNETLALTLPSFYDNWKDHLVPAHLSHYKMSEQELIGRNGGKPIYNV
jgi:hypothetical protein